MSSPKRDLPGVSRLVSRCACRRPSCVTSPVDRRRAWPGTGIRPLSCVTLSLDEVTQAPAAAGFLAAVLFGVLITPASLAAIGQHCTRPSRHKAWLALAAACCPPFRERCAVLADACGWRRAA